MIEKNAFCRSPLTVPFLVNILPGTKSYERRIVEIRSLQCRIVTLGREKASSESH